MIRSRHLKNYLYRDQYAGLYALKIMVMLWSVDIGTYDSNEYTKKKYQDTQSNIMCSFLIIRIKTGTKTKTEFMLIIHVFFFVTTE